MAECLVKDKISRDCFKNILVFNESLYDQKSQAKIEKIRPLAEALGIGIKYGHWLCKGQNLDLII